MKKSKSCQKYNHSKALKERLEKEQNLVFSVVPDWPENKWSSFFADRYDAVWSDGTIGFKELRRIPTENEKIDLQLRIRAAREKVLKYDKELQDAFNYLNKNNI